MAQKNLLQSAGDGTAIPAGYVGEFVRATSTSLFTQNGPTSGTFYGVTNLILTIPSAGVWLVGYNASVQTDPPSGASSEIIGRARLRNTTDNTDICGAVSNYSVTGTVASVIGNSSSQTVININSSKTIQVQIGFITNGGTPSVTNIYERGDRTSPFSQVFAVRIA